MNTTHVQLPRDSRRQRAGESPAAPRPRNGDSAGWQRQRNAPRCRSLICRRNRVRDLLLRAKHLFVAAIIHKRNGAVGEGAGSGPWAGGARPRPRAPRAAWPLVNVPTATLALPRRFPRAEVGKLRGEIFRCYGPKSDAWNNLLLLS